MTDKLEDTENKKGIRVEKMIGNKTRKIKIPITIAGFIVLAIGIVVLLNAIFMTSPGEFTIWGITLTVGILLIIIGVLAIHHGG